MKCNEETTVFRRILSGIVLFKPNTKDIYYYKDIIRVIIVIDSKGNDFLL
jgi:hypothetical protein